MMESNREKCEWKTRLNIPILEELSVASRNTASSANIGWNIRSYIRIEIIV